MCAFFKNIKTFLFQIMQISFQKHFRCCPHMSVLTSKFYLANNKYKGYGVLYMTTAKTKQKI